jgi:predicted GNAT superfamily acetyltransferase
VESHLSKRARRPLVLEDYLSAGFEVINPIMIDEDGWPKPIHIEIDSDGQFSVQGTSLEGAKKSMVLVEIPPDFVALKAANPEVALEWRLHTRQLFETLFAQGYLITGFVHHPGDPTRSVYILTRGESTL